MSDTPRPPDSGDMALHLEQAAEAARQAHAARQRADDDASYAHNAKVASEEHSKAIAGARGQAEADASWFTTTRQGVEEAHAVIVKIKADAEGANQTVAAAQAEVEKGRAAVGAALEEVTSFRSEAHTAKTDAAAQAKAAGTHKVNAEGFSGEAEAARDKTEAAKNKVETTLAELDELAKTTREHAAEVGGLLAEVKEAKVAADTLVASMKAADTKAAFTLDVIKAHEKDLAKLKGDFEAIHARIESLLPNATSAGLATAFREQKARFARPQQLWLVTFVVTIAGLLASSLWGLPATGESWDSIGRHFINRLPLIAPLVWLAIYAGRHYGLALRLQEEYAYKEAVSAAFEGYKREMGTVGTAADGGSPLVTLCETVLRTLGQRPGRIYEGKHEDITPANTVANAARDILEVAKDAVKAAAGKKPEASG